MVKISVFGIIGVMFNIGLLLLLVSLKFFIDVQEKGTFRAVALVLFTVSMMSKFFSCWYFFFRLHFNWMIFVLFHSGVLNLAFSSIGEEGEILKKHTYFRCYVGFSIFSLVTAVIIASIERYKERAIETTSTPECFELNESTYLLNDPDAISGLFIAFFSLCKKWIFDMKEIYMIFQLLQPIKFAIIWTAKTFERCHFSYVYFIWSIRIQHMKNHVDFSVWSVLIPNYNFQYPFPFFSPATFLLKIENWSVNRKQFSKEIGI